MDTTLRIETVEVPNYGDACEGCGKATNYYRRLSPDNGVTPFVMWLCDCCAHDGRAIGNAYAIKTDAQIASAEHYAEPAQWSQTAT